MNNLVAQPVTLTVPVRLDFSPEQFRALRRTMLAFNAACNFAADAAFRDKAFDKFALQKRVYRDLRQKFALSAQLAVRAISKVAEALKRDHTVRPVFRDDGAVVYDQRILSWKGEDKVSLLTLEGRILVPLRLGNYQRDMLKNKKRGQADLLIRKARAALYIAVEAPAPPPYEPLGFLGVDLGIVNLAVDSDGKIAKGAAVDGVRERAERLKAALQARGTRSAKRHLKRQAGCEARFRRNENHLISKALVARAQGTRRGIALENLKGISGRTTVRRPQRRRHKSWAFGQLRAFVAYKAALAGVPLVVVDPRGTSTTCPTCGHCVKANRPTREEFRCVSCGHSGPADYTAAINIAARARVNAPIVAGDDGHHAEPRPDLSYKPSALAGGS